MVRFAGDFVKETTIHQDDENDKLSNITNDTDKKIVKNIIFVAISNILTLLSGILVGFILPKIMSKADYGYYKTFTLYLSYVGLFHFGFIDGIYLIYAGFKYETLDKEKFRLYSRFLIIFQSIISLLIVITAIPLLKNYVGVIILCLGINLLLQNVTSYYQFISQITGRFRELSFRNVIKALLTSISICVLTLLFYFKVISIVNYTIYILVYTGIQALLVIWYIFTYRDITFGKAKQFKTERNNIIHLFKIGIPLLIANLVSGLILSIDRQFVSILFEIEDYAVYAFAYNMLNLITTVIAAISTVLYPTIKTYNEEQLKNNYNRLIAIISIVVAFCIGAYYPLKFILETFLNNYLDSLPIFRVILPSLLISSCISMIMFNYYKSLNKQGAYFVISIIILGVSIVANAISYMLFKTTISISIASVIVMILWYFIVEPLIVKKFKINTLKNILYIASIMTVFYTLTEFVENVFLGFAIYFIAFIVITIIFHYHLIKSKFKSY